MLIPVLNFILSPKSSPITWMIFIVSTMVFITTYSAQNKEQTKLESFMQDDEFVATQGIIFSSFLNNSDRSSSSHNPFLNQIATIAREKQPKKYRSLGVLAFRDISFLQNVYDHKFQGDMIAYDKWQKGMKEIKQSQLIHPSYLWGLSLNKSSWLYYLTYQVLHSGETHLLGNMFFLLIFGSFLEPMIGSIALLFLYISSGIFGAWLFVMVNGLSIAPLIGASGAVSGLMGCFSILYWRQNVRFFWALPIKPYWGIIFLPAWLVIIMWVIGDLSGFLSTPKEFGGVANIAHLGGTLWGILIGCFFTNDFFKNKENSIIRVVASDFFKN